MNGHPLYRMHVIVIVSLLSASAAQGQTVLYVDGNAPGPHNGTSWEYAYTDLQDALTEAASIGGLVEIRVAEGAYKPTLGTDRDVSFELLNSVGILGGYAGYGEPDPDERDIEAYETILSGDLDGDDVPEDPFANYDDNSYRIVTIDQNNALAKLEGFTIAGATRHAVHVTGGEAQLLSLLVKHNQTAAYGPPDTHGAGLYLESGSHPAVSDCTFQENDARAHGGGVYNGEGCRPRLTNCRFVGNDADYGGGFYNQSGS